MIRITTAAISTTRNRMTNFAMLGTPFSPMVVVKKYLRYPKLAGVLYSP
jgi:hypothetical protein